MTDPNLEVERLMLCVLEQEGERPLPMTTPSSTGAFVRHSDYEKLEKERDYLQAECRRRHDEVTHEQEHGWQPLRRRTEKAEAERDQAKAQALAEVREALLDKRNEAERGAGIAEERGEALLFGTWGGYLDGLDFALSTLEDTQGEGT